MPVGATKVFSAQFILELNAKCTTASYTDVQMVFLVQFQSCNFRIYRVCHNISINQLIKSTMFPGYPTIKISYPIKSELYLTLYTTHLTAIVIADCKLGFKMLAD